MIQWGKRSESREGGDGMPPLSLLIKPASGRCNMRCGYCFYREESVRQCGASGSVMSPETLEILLRRAFAYADGSLVLSFQGGEPTLAGASFYSALPAIERRYNSRRIPVTHAIQTNGLAVDAALASELSAQGFLVGVSLDGTQPVHDANRRDAAGCGTWKRVRDTAAGLAAQGIPVNVLCVVTDETAARAEEVIEALWPYGYLQFIPCLENLYDPAGTARLSPEGWGLFLKTLWRHYARAARSNRPVSVRILDNWLQMLAGYPPESCGMSGRCAPNLTVESDGTVYPCDFYATDEWKLGNIRDSSFFALMRSPRLASFLDAGASAPACAGCPYAFLCRGGCRRERDASGALRLCAGLKAFFGECLPGMERLSRELFSGG